MRGSRVAGERGIGEAGSSLRDDRMVKHITKAKNQPMKNAFLLILVLVMLPFIVLPQSDSTTAKPKKRYSFPTFPILAYDADMGFQYGIVSNMYDFGDWSKYPEYRHAVKVEISRFTKGSGINQLFYDSKYLIPGNIRITAEVSYLTERALDFYGFNGYEAAYNKDFTNEESDDYISRVYYKHDRNILRLMADSQFVLRFPYWLAVRLFGGLVWRGKKTLRKWRSEVAPVPLPYAAPSAVQNLDAPDHPII